jgi:hypothetical protein
VWLSLARVAQHTTTFVPFGVHAWLPGGLCLPADDDQRMFALDKSPRAQAACHEARREKGNHRDPVIFEVKKMSDDGGWIEGRQTSRRRQGGGERVGGLLMLSICLVSLVASISRAAWI